MQPGPSVWFLPFTFCHTEPLPSFLSPPLVIYSIYFACHQHKQHIRQILLFCVFLFSLSPDLNFQYFWKWSAFEDYLLFCFGFTVLCAVVTLLLLDSAVFVETLGSLAVLFEAMLGVPQLLQNFHNHSTKGMRYDSLGYWTEISIQLRGQSDRYTEAVMLCYSTWPEDAHWQNMAKNEKKQVSHWLSYLPINLLITLNKFAGISNAAITN